jgi:hypothetical protein
MHELSTSSASSDEPTKRAALTTSSSSIEFVDRKDHSVDGNGRVDGEDDNGEEEEEDDDERNSDDDDDDTTEDDDGTEADTINTQLISDNDEHSIKSNNEGHYSPIDSSNEVNFAHENNSNNGYIDNPAQTTALTVVPYRFPETKRSTLSAFLANPRDCIYNLNILTALYDNSTLKDWLENPKRTTRVAKNGAIFEQILRGLAYIHEQGLIVSKRINA